MAPEQIEGHPRPASDQYALGVVVYEWLCGERPFEGSVSEVMAQHLSMPPPPLRERVPAIPPEVEQVVLRALAKDPKARFASVAHFAIALEQASQRALTSTATACQRTACSQFGCCNEAMRRWRLHQINPSCQRSRPHLPICQWELSSRLCTQAPRHQMVTTHLRVELRLRHRSRDQLVAPMAAVVSPPLEPTMPVQRKARRVSREPAQGTSHWTGGRGRRRRYPGQPEPARALWGAGSTQRYHHLPWYAEAPGLMDIFIESRFAHPQWLGVLRLRQ